ncbi:AAA family ATPase [uncultured Acetatifactor sp.]|jgi:predicted ATP-binding protein involved in virulence|uniref:AAA family ATPase n=1 Tax=uncultured Acetatifactor sp. TaxID=1671927 RepID=UPI002633639F|nr:AAA family ATPase [uncultured Acetatifactor sp.]
MKDFVIESISLSNYRKFENNTFRLNPGMNVFIGKNASGKTTVLEAASVMLGAYLAAFKEYVPSRFVQNISDADVHRKNNKFSKQLATPQGVPQFPCSIKCVMKWDNKEIPFQRILEKEGSRTKFAGKNPMQMIVNSWEELIKAADGSDEKLQLPLVLYLSSARLWNENRVEEMSKTPNRTDAYRRCLDRKRSSQTGFDYIKLLSSLAVEENGGRPFDSYEIIMGALKDSLAGELKDGEQIIYSSRIGEIGIRQEDGTVIEFSALSDGYRNVIKIVTDIATRMCILNPYLGADVLRLTPGVVIIDELDLSLHPTWQRRIVRILKTIFPQVQFICATHSPFIIQSLEEGELIALDNEIEEPYSGESIEDIAENIMDVSTAKYSEKKEAMYHAAEEYFQALNGDVTQERMDELKDRLDVLSAEYSDNPAYNAYMKLKYLEKKAEAEE